MFGFQSRSPDHPPAIAGRRYSGADKKEKQERGKQKQRRRQKHPAFAGLLFGTGNSNGAGALHRQASKSSAMMRDSARFCKPRR